MADLDAEVFVGRRAELDNLRAALDQARQGNPQIVVLQGPGGIGKTTLLDRFLNQESDLTVLRVSGEQWENLLPYGLLDQLARVAGNVGLLLPGADASAAEQPITVGSRLLDLWSELQDERVVVTVIDDAHWADVDSLRALLFAVRRLITDRVMVVVALRDLQSSSIPEGLRRMAAGPTGRVISLNPLRVNEIAQLASKLGAESLPAGTAERLHRHTEGNPLYLRAVINETPTDAWRQWEPALPAPREFTAGVIRRMEACPPEVQSFIEAGSVLGLHFALQTAADLSEVSDPLAVVDVASSAGILSTTSGPQLVDVKFSHPMTRAAVYDQLPLARRAALHAGAARLVEDEPESLQHRVAAARGPDPTLVADLESYATREASRGAWASAASTLAVISRLSPSESVRQQLLVRAVDAMVAGGDLVRAKPFVAEIAGFAPSARRDATLGHLAILDGNPAEAEKQLRAAWINLDKTLEPDLPASLAQRNALHSMGRLRPLDMIEWAQQAITLGSPDQPERADAHAILGIGLGLVGRADEGLAIHESVLSTTSSPGRGSNGLAVRMANGWLRLATDDFAAAATGLSEAAPAALRAGSYRVAVYAFTWLARAHFHLGAWDEAIVDADRAVTLLSETEHEWLRPLVHWMAAAVPAARGDWATADQHAAAAAAGNAAYELMLLCGGMAKAQVAAAHGDHGGVLESLEPVLTLMPRQGIEEPGFWSWQHLYVDALTGTGRLAEAEAFLGPREDLAARRNHRSTMARLARSRGRLASAVGDAAGAIAAFEFGAQQLQQLPLPFEKAQLELAWGQALRRTGQRRIAAERLRTAGEIFAALGAQPFLERTERELMASGLAPARRKDYDPNRLTPHELAVANLVGKGMSNRQIAAEIMVSIKTVQAHLTKIYAKVGVASRAELAARIHQDGSPATNPP